MSKQFTGIWMPMAILNDDRLTLAEKVLLAYTGSFPGRCFASDEHMGKMLGKSPKTIANMLSILRKKGLFSGRDFPKSGNDTSRNPGMDFPKSGNIDIRGEIRVERRRKTASPDLTVYEQGEQREVLIGLVADRGIGKEYIAPTLDITIKEVRAGLSPEPVNWPAYLAGRIRKENRKAKAFEPRQPAPPVSQFSKVYS